MSRSAARATIVALAFGAASIAWLDPQADRAEAGNQLFRAGKYDEAIAKYGEALIDQPESPLLNFNMATAHFKAGHYDKAIDSFQRVRVPESDTILAGNTALGIGSSYFRMAEAAESSKPQDALKQYAMALVAYRRGLGIDHTARGPKVGYEAALRRIEALKKKLEEQKKQQEQNKKDDQKQEQNQSQEQQDKDKQQQQDKQDQQKQDQQDKQPDQQQGDEQKQPDEQQKAPDDKKPDDGQTQPPEDQQQQPEKQQQAGGDSGDEAGEDQGDSGGEATEAGEPKDGMSRKEAAALLDSARTEELDPSEFVKRSAPAGVAEPSRDW